MLTSHKINALLTIFVLALAYVVPQRSLPGHQQQTGKLPESALLHVTVEDEKGRLVLGLKETNFQILIDKKPARIISFENDSPVSVGIVFDSSRSIVRSRQRAQKLFVALGLALERFIELSNPANDYFVMGFNPRPKLLVNWTSDRKAISDQFQGMNISEDSALHDTCYLATDKLQSASHVRRALILLTYGKDTASRYSFNELQEYLRESDVIIYSLHLPNDSQFGNPIDHYARVTLDQLCFVTGGRAFYARDIAGLSQKEVNLVLEHIASELRSQYAIRIAPEKSNQAKKLRKIQVKLKLPPDAPRELRNSYARTREGIYD